MNDRGRFYSDDPIVYPRHTNIRNISSSHLVKFDYLLFGHVYVFQRQRLTLPSKYQANAIFSLVASPWKSTKIIYVFFCVPQLACQLFQMDFH